MNIISVVIGLVSFIMLIISFFYPPFIWLGGMALPISVLGFFIGAMSRYYKIGAVLNFLLVVAILLWLLISEEIIKIH